MGVPTALPEIKTGEGAFLCPMDCSGQVESTACHTSQRTREMGTLVVTPPGE